MALSTFRAAPEALDQECAVILANSFLPLWYADIIGRGKILSLC
jgi:hypothetical protein